VYRAWSIHGRIVPAPPIQQKDPTSFPRQRTLGVYQGKNTDAGSYFGHFHNFDPEFENINRLEIKQLSYLSPRKNKEKLRLETNGRAKPAQRAQSKKTPERHDKPTQMGTQ